MINNYVGIPWLKGGNTKKGADCWGLATLVLREVYNIVVNEYSNSKATGDELADIIKKESNCSKWLPVIKPEAGNLGVTKDKKHICVYIGNGKIIHAIEKLNSSSQVHNLRTIEKLLGPVVFYARNTSIT